MIHIKESPYKQQHYSNNPSLYCVITVDIVGLLIHTRPPQTQMVRRQLEKLPGVEVHLAAPDGRQVVTIESCDKIVDIAWTLDQIDAIPGIQSTTLIYHHTEPLSDETADKE